MSARVVARARYTCGVPVLVLLKADGSERVDPVYELTGTDLILGRGEGVAIPVIDPTISRQHARVVLHEGKWWAMSLSPQNPIRVAGRPGFRRFTATENGESVKADVEFRQIHLRGTISRR